MPDWSKSMQQSFEYFVVDPITWADGEKLENIKSSTVSRDRTVETLGSATLDATGTVGECYIRIYLITIQNGITERFPLGTFLVQTPSSNFDGKIRSVSMDAYTPLLELKEKRPVLGYYTPKDSNIVDTVYTLTRENARAPLVEPICEEVLNNDFVANTSDTWLSYLSDLLQNAKYEFSLDEMGRILFSPKQETASLQPVWTFDDGNSSILYPELSMNHDLFNIPNVVEVIYSNGRDYYYSRVVNDDVNSPISTVNRGREIIHRDTEPSIAGVASQYVVDEYANRLLKELSTVEYSVSYTHAYCGVRVDDCVRLNYERAGIKNVKAKVVSQNISCVQGCPVSEKAVFTTKLWR